MCEIIFQISWDKYKAGFLPFEFPIPLSHPEKYYFITDWHQIGIRPCLFPCRPIAETLFRLVTLVTQSSFLRTLFRWEIAWHSQRASPLVCIGGYFPFFCYSILLPAWGAVFVPFCRSYVTVHVSVTRSFKAWGCVVSLENSFARKQGKAENQFFSLFPFSLIRWTRQKNMEVCVQTWPLFGSTQIPIIL